MTRIVAAIKLTLGPAAPAAADTVARRTPAVGPALAGDLVAWGEEAHNGAVRVMVAVVTRIAASDVGATTIDDAALQDDGTVAFTFASRLGQAALGTPGVRTIARRVAFRGVALAAGRVLYERSNGELVLRPLSDGPPRRLARFRPGHRRVGDLDLDATRATWATRVPHGPARIVVRSL